MSASTGSSASPAPHGTPQPAIDLDLLCQQCGYNLRGLTGHRCPECGQTLDTVRATHSTIPWTYRRERGLLRTYWRTVFFVCFREGLLCDEAAREVSYADARAFRRLTILFAWLPLLTTTILLSLLRPRAAQFVFVWETWGSVWVALLAHAAFLLWMASAAGLVGSLFHPRHLTVRQQNRAVALSQYTCAPLSMMFVPHAFAVVALLLPQRLDDTAIALLIYAVLAALGTVLAWWLIVLHMMRRLLSSGFLHRLLAVVVMPAAWLALAVACVAVPTLLVGYARMVYVSGRLGG